MFVAVAQWYCVFFSLVLTEPFWHGSVFGLAMSLFAFGIAWMKSLNTSEKDYVRVSERSKEMIRILTLGLIRFK
jgi:hypothetical protein